MSISFHHGTVLTLLSPHLARHASVRRAVRGRICEQRACPADHSPSAFPTESGEIDRTANGVRFRWTLANSSAYAPVSKCLSDLGSQNAKRSCTLGCRQNFVGSQSKFAHFWSGTLPASCA